MLIKRRINTTTTRRNVKTEQLHITIVLCMLWNYSCKNRRLDQQMRSDRGIYVRLQADTLAKIYVEK